MQDNDDKISKKKRNRRFFALYVLTFAVFLAYFFFLSDHTFKTHLTLNRKINNLEEKIVNTKNQIGNIYTYEQLMADSALLEKYGREQLNMHRPDEDVFVILYE